MLEMVAEMRRMILARDLRIALLEDQLQESRRQLAGVVVRCKQAVSAVHAQADRMLDRCYRQTDRYDALAARLVDACRIAGQLRPLLDMNKVFKLQRDRLASQLTANEEVLRSSRQESATKEKRLAARLSGLQSALQLLKSASTTIKWQQEDFGRYMQMMSEVVLHRLSLHRCRRADEQGWPGRVDLDGRLSRIEDRYRLELADIIRTDTMNNLT